MNRDAKVLKSDFSPPCNFGCKESSNKVTTNLQLSLKLKSNEFFPHISLFYGIATKQSKEKVIKRLSTPKEFMLESISLVDVDENINSWKVIERFPLN